MAKTRVYKSGNSFSVRLPAGIAFDRTDIEYEIKRDGDTIHLRPAPRKIQHFGSLFNAFNGPVFVGRQEARS